VWTDFDKFDNLSKRNVKLILKIFSDLEPLEGSSNKKTLYSTRSCVIWPFFGTREPLKLSFHSSFKLAHSCQKKPKLHTNPLNKLLFSPVGSNYYSVIIIMYFKNFVQSVMKLYWVIQNDCGQVWQLCTKIYVATVWIR
jgi:hypothetical protein